MSHITDGELHAWLDGAIADDSEEGHRLREHLESCPQCEQRLDEERTLREEAGDILGTARPAGDPPAFEEIRRRAGLVEGGAVSDASRGERLRRGWSSAQKLGWAATVLLALGAGWIGRAVLVERGWQDPFHESAAVAPESATEPAAGVEADLETFADDVRTEAEADNEPGRRRDQARQANEEQPKPAEAAPGPDVGFFKDAEAKDADRMAAREISGGDAEGLAQAAAPSAEEEPAPLRRTGELAQAEPQVAEKVDAADELADAPAEVAEMEMRARSVQPALDPWHQVPAPRVEPPATGTPGCYRLEYSWSPGMVYLPGIVELTRSESRPGLFLYVVSVPGGPPDVGFSGTWAAPAPDSVWVQLGSGGEGEALTVRAGRVESGWIGEGRVLRPAAPVSRDQVRGPVQLLSVGCDRP